MAQLVESAGQHEKRLLEQLNLGNQQLDEFKKRLAGIIKSPGGILGGKSAINGLFKL